MPLLNVRVIVPTVTAVVVLYLASFIVLHPWKRLHAIQPVVAGRSLSDRSSARRGLGTLDFASVQGDYRRVYHPLRQYLQYRAHSSAPPRPKGIPKRLHSVLAAYGEWHTRTVAAAGDRLGELLEQAMNASATGEANITAEAPGVAVAPTARPDFVISLVGWNGLADNIKVSVDLFLLAVMTQRLFFVHHTKIPFQDFFWSPYLQWYHPAVSAVLPQHLPYLLSRGPRPMVRHEKAFHGRQPMTRLFGRAFTMYCDDDSSPHWTGYPLIVAMLDFRPNLPLCHSLGITHLPVEVV
eukprot:RCo022716